MKCFKELVALCFFIMLSGIAKYYETLHSSKSADILIVILKKILTIHYYFEQLKKNIRCFVLTNLYQT